MSIALISCGKTKRDGTHAAQDLYIGTYFKKTLAYAKKHHDQIYILSAKYGLLELDQQIESYEMKITQLSKHDRNLWGLAVTKQLRAKNIDNDEIYIYAGKPYYELLIPYLPKANIMFEGLSIGHRMKAMS